MSVYVLDSNFFIQAHRSTYPLDIAFSFWNKIKQLAHDGRIISIDKVKGEIYDKNDALEEWCKANLPLDFFKDTDSVMHHYGVVSTWAISRSNHYTPQALNEFLDAEEADAFIIAFALADAGNRIIVTQEISAPGSKSKIKIPDVCMALNMKYTNSMDMFRQLGEGF